MPVSTVQPESGDSANTGNTPKSDALNVLLKISLNDSKSETLEVSKMIKQTGKTYGKLKRYKNAFMIREKEPSTQTTITRTQTQISVKSELQFETRNVWVHPSRHTASFQRRYDVVRCRTTAYRR